MGATVVGVVIVDLECNGLGLRSFADQPMGRSSVLGATLERLARGKSVDRWFVSAPARDADVVRALIGRAKENNASSATVDFWNALTLDVHDEAPPSGRRRIQRARRWSIAGWRGGLARTTLLDEEFHSGVLARLAREGGAAWIAQARAESCLLDPALFDMVIDQAKTTTPPPPLVYGAIPPGLAGWALRADVLSELNEKNLYPGFILGYRDWDPSPDLTEQLWAPKPPIVVSARKTRFLADHRAGYDRCRRLIADHPAASAESLCCIAAEDDRQFVPNVPRELEIELDATVDGAPASDDALRTPLDALARLFEDFARTNDVGLVTLGGRGDALAAQHGFEIAELASAAGLAVAVRTKASSLTPLHRERLLQSRIDVVEARIDGRTSSLDRSQLDALLVERNSASMGGDGTPLVVVAIERSAESLPHLRAWYDEWTRKADGAYLAPLRAEDLSATSRTLLDVTPPVRRPCVRLSERLFLAPDGNMRACEEDRRGQLKGSSWVHESLDALWLGDAVQQWRLLHREGRWDQLEPCRGCTEWHRA